MYIPPGPSIFLECAVCANLVASFCLPVVSLGLPVIFSVGIISTADPKYFSIAVLLSFSP
jgi:hypothetical protein